MSAMTPDTQAFLQAALAAASDRAATLPACAAARQQGHAGLAQGLPDGKFEQWKYTRIQPFYDPAFIKADVPPGHEPAPGFVLNLPSGHLSLTPQGPTTALPQHPGLQVQRLDQVDAATQILLRAHFFQGIDNQRHVLNPLNLALLQDAYLIRVAPGAHQIPLLRLHQLAQQHSCRRVLLLLEPESRLQLLEDYALQAASNLVLEAVVQAGAQLTHYRVQPASNAAVWSLTHVQLAQQASYTLHTYALAGAPHRNEIHVQLCGPGAQARLQGAFLGNGKGKLDHQLCIEHKAPDCSSWQQFHGVALDRAELTFNGRIHIHPQAQRTDAQLSNKNLLGSDQAKINTKPELEIYADDVRCAHGATVGALDADALFYLRSRGVPAAQARSMLLRGFIGALVPCDDQLGIGPALQQVLSQWQA